MTALLAFNLNIFLWVLGGVLLSGLIMWPVMYLITANIVYKKVMYRKDKTQWSREVSANDAEHVAMYGEGMEWHSLNVDKKTDVHIVRDGLNLYGEYYNFGFGRCAIILSGRTESLNYGYYFAKPYVASGYNVLFVDPRAHGLSDGEFNTAGFEESKDALAWAAHIHDNFGVKSIIFHGICIGSAAAMFAITSDQCPDYIEGMVAEGMFANFSESMKNHLIERKKPVFMLNGMIDTWMKHYTGHSMKYGPINVINKMNKPLLMLHSKEDLYSVPEYAKKLYDGAPSKAKRLVWFDHGRHSLLRFTDTPKYDKAIEQFIADYFDCEKAA